MKKIKLPFVPSKDYDLKSRLMWYFLLLSIIPLIFFGVASYIRSTELLNKKINFFTVQLITESKIFLDNKVGQVEKIISIVSRNESLKNVMNISEPEVKMKILFNDYIASGSGINNIYIGTTNGKLYSGVDMNIKGDFRNQIWFLKAVEEKTGNLIWTDVHKSPITNSRVITIAKSIYDLKGNLIGVLACDFDIEGISFIISSVRIGNEGCIVLVDNNGIIIGGKDKYIGNRYDESFKQKINSYGSSLFMETPYKSFKWKIIGIIPKYESEKDNSDFFVSMIILIFISTLLVLFFVNKFSSRAVKPIVKLRDLMLKGASGDLDIQFDTNSITEYNIKEYSEMTEAYNKMVFKLKVLKQSLEQKIEQKTQMTEELKKANDELNKRQVELLILNEEMAGTNKDLEHANKELRFAHAKLVQSEKMASLGMLVAGIAHEINTPLGAIHCNIDLYNAIIHRLKNNPIVLEEPSLKDLVEKFEMANKTNQIASERIMEIVKSLRIFGREDISEGEMKAGDIHIGIDSTLLLLNSKIKNKIDVIKEYGDIPEIKCFPNQLNQVFMNILVNAVHAIPEYGKIWIKTYSDNEKIYIKIKDNGNGIKKENLEKIFDPGFTTKGVGIGTGLGLSIVYNIIEKHNGKIYVESEEGKGTEFTIEIPIVF